MSSVALCDITMTSINLRIKKFGWLIDANSQAVLFLSRDQQLLQSQAYGLHPAGWKWNNDTFVFCSKTFLHFCVLKKER